MYYSYKNKANIYLWKTVINKETLEVLNVNIDVYFRYGVDGEDRELRYLEDMWEIMFILGYHPSKKL